jgi:hypothetical protein
MKRRLAALSLAFVLLCTGCSSMLQRTYSSSVSHVEYAVSEDSSVLRAENYRGLVDAILYFVNAHTEQGTIRLYNYTTDVEGDLADARQEVLLEDPLAAYAVEDIDSSFSRIVSYYEVTLTITYAHTLQEISGIVSVANASAAQQELQEAMSGFPSSLTVWITYFTGDEETLRSMAVKAYYDTPVAAFGLPEISVSLYPDTGTKRIAQLDFQWQAPLTTLLPRASRLRSAAQAVLGEHPAAGGAYTAQELSAILDEICPDMDPEGSGTPDAALSGERANLLSRTLALELLCQLAGLDVTLVTGVADGADTCWLLVSTDGGWRHLLPGGEDGPRLLTDLEMSGLGYLWNTELYPASVDYDADLSGTPTEETTPEDETPEDSAAQPSDELSSQTP